MFKRKNNFAECEHKEVVLGYRDSEIVSATLECPKLEDSGQSIAVTGTQRHLEVLGKRNSKEASFSGVYLNADAAYKHLGEQACAIACKGCAFAKMTPIDVSVQRRDGALDKQTLAVYEEERIAAQLVLQDKEQNTVTPQGGGEITALEAAAQDPTA